MLDRSAASNLGGRVLVYATAIAVMPVSRGGIAVLGAEQDTPGAKTSRRSETR
jgi:hypothetical protein